jgi:protein transport protein SEC13
MAAATANNALAATTSPPAPLYVDTQHEDLVHDAQMDYYGAKLATCSSGELPVVCLFGYFANTACLES